MGNGKSVETARLSSRTSDNEYCVNYPFPVDPPHELDAPDTVAFADQLRASRWAALASWAALSGAMGARAKARAARGGPNSRAHTTTSYGSKISGNLA
jgi:hypothetical protein